MVALGLAVVLALALLPGVASAAVAVSFTFEGGGYGHSVGMSQYGAYGMALEGYTWQEILSHYFTGASPADADPALAATPLWVSLVEERTRIELTVVATGTTSPVPVTFTQGSASLIAGAGAKVVIEYLGGGICRVSGLDGSMEGPCSVDASWDGWQDQPTTALELAGCVLPDWNAPGGTVWRPCRYALGSLHVRPDNTVGFDVSIEIGLEAYLLGISESPYSWGSTGGMAELQAQAVAARSYALHRAIERGDPASRPWCWCHLYDTTVDQFYVGWGHTTREWLEAVATTTGKVMTHPSETRNGALIPIETFYSSSTFGWTEDSENGFTAYVPYLRAVDDHWSRLPEAGNPYARWTRTFTAANLASLLPGMSTVTGATVTRCSATGAALEITFTGQGGPRTFTTRDLRGRLGLRSMQVFNVGAPPPEIPACRGPALDPLEPGGPVTLAALSIDDDATGDSLGNGDGVAQCGEVIEVFTTITNQGLPLDQVAATLSSADPYVSIVWNNTSPFPDLAAGASAANEADWDLAIAPDTPAGHTATLDMRVTSANGGPWDLAVRLPLSCADPLEGVLASPGDVDRDGVGDAAVAYSRPGEAAGLKVYSGASGAVLAAANLAAPGYFAVATAVVPSFAGSPADEVAVLLTAPGRAARVVVIDAASGRRLGSFGLGSAATYLGMAALPSVGGSAAGELAVLAVRPDGSTRMLLRDAATGAQVGSIGFGRGLSPTGLAVIPAADGGSHLALIGNDSGGTGRVVIRDAGDGRLVRRFGLASGLVARDFVALRGPGGSPVLVALATDAASGTVRLIAADAVTGSVLASFPVANLVAAFDIEALADLGGGASADVAVLGRASDGTVVATVVDPFTGSLLSAPEFPGGYLIDDLAALGGGNLAVLARTEGDGSLLAVRGTTTGSFPVP
jgi:SpoIID/LytB domain protein